MSGKGKNPARSSLLAVAAVLLFALAWVYGEVRHHRLIPFDDDLYVVENPLLHGQPPRGGWVALWTQPYDGNWIPLTWLSYRLNQWTTGLEPGALLLTNVALHGASTVLLLIFLFRATGALARSAFVAGVFALHPLHVESVAWAAERKDVLCGFFWMAALLAYRRYCARSTPSRYLALVLLTAAALLSKPMAVTLPFALLLLDFWPLGRLGRESGRPWPLDARGLGKRVAEKLPLFALAAAVGAITYLAQRSAGAMEGAASIPLATRIENAFVSYAGYLAKAFWPARLAVFYPLSERPPPAAEWIGATALLLAACAGAAAAARRSPAVFVGWFWFLGTLVPVIGLVQVGLQARADRYAYLPLVGLSVAVAWGASELGQRLRVPRRAGIAVVAAALLALAVVARAQVAIWRDGVTLFRHALETTGPANRTARAGLGLAEIRNGRIQAGVRDLAAALGWQPTSPGARARLFSWLMRRAGASLRAGNAALAVTSYRTALALRPRDVRVHLRLARALARQCRLSEAKRHLRQAMRLAPDLRPRTEGWEAKLEALCRG